MTSDAEATAIARFFPNGMPPPGAVTEEVANRILAGASADARKDLALPSSEDPRLIQRCRHDW